MHVYTETQEAPKRPGRPRKYEGRGAPIVQTRVPPELAEWVDEQGGGAFVRELLLQARQQQAVPTPPARYGTARELWVRAQVPDPLFDDVDVDMLKDREAVFLRPFTVHVELAKWLEAAGGQEFLLALLRQYRFHVDRLERSFHFCHERRPEVIEYILRNSFGPLWETALRFAQPKVLEHLLCRTTGIGHIATRERIHQRLLELRPNKPAECPHCAEAPVPKTRRQRAEA